MAKSVETAHWYLEGDYFEACNCQSVCPCIWKQPPSEGDCKLLVAWHIQRGQLDGVSLANLNVVLACHAPGLMIEGGWQAVLYLDERVDRAQRNALEQIFSGRKGGHPALLAGFMASLEGVHLARTIYESKERVRRLVVEGVAQAEIEGVEGIRGGVSTIDNPPLCVVPSHPSAVSRSRYLSFQDAHFQWEFSNRNGFYSPFVYRP